ncbi:hypothetical protein FACS1894199_18410 [Bacteroidia bacterium]|nr:hypothetical protein FACS1894199_18410 [Bacteroidia bacterium]
MEITEENGIYADIILKFSIEQLHDNENFISLLFYMGLLTIDRFDGGRLRLKIPNYSIRTVYWEYIMRLTKDRNTEILTDNVAQTDSVWELAYNGNPAPYIEYMSKNIISRLSNRDLQNFDEKYIKLLLLNGLFQSKLFVPITEMEVTHGYTDIYLKRNHLLPDIPCEWVWEVKYVKKGDAENIETQYATSLQEKRDEAVMQLTRYRDSHLFAGRTDVRYLSVIFIGKDKYELKEL